MESRFGTSSLYRLDVQQKSAVTLVLSKTCLKGRYGSSTKFNTLWCFLFALRGFACRTEGSRFCRARKTHLSHCSGAGSKNHITRKTLLALNNISPEQNGASNQGLLY